jgi:hypothetical protein
VCSAIIICVVIYFVYKSVFKKSKSKTDTEKEVPNKEPLLSTV